MYVTNVHYDQVKPWAAPKIQADAKGSPQCVLDDLWANSKNGCPPLLEEQATSRAAFPACLGKSDKTKRITTAKQFHCFLSCTHVKPQSQHDQDADDMCPTGAVCMMGMRRNPHQGVCVFPSSA